MPVIVNMACGLANRMFQYSYYLYLKKLGFEVLADYYTAARLPHENVEWARIFPEASLVQAPSGLVFRLGGGQDIFSRLRRRYNILNGVKQMPTAFDYWTPEHDGKDRYIIGVFQNAGMVDSVKDEVLAAFEFSEFEDKANIELAREMAGCNSVAIHVRKGKDYMERIWYRNTCGMDYYRKAVDYISSRVESPKFYVFTDNPEWVKENFEWIDYRLVQGNPTSGWGSHFDMQLMSCCRHSIVSNSTYSWWGAYLDRNADKIVVIPEIWFNPESCGEYTSRRVLCKGWTAL